MPNCRNGLLDRDDMTCRDTCRLSMVEDAKYSKLVAKYGPLDVFHANG